MLFREYVLARLCKESKNTAVLFYGVISLMELVEESLT